MLNIRSTKRTIISHLKSPKYDEVKPCNFINTHFVHIDAALSNMGREGSECGEISSEVRKVNIITCLVVTVKKTIYYG
jgi:hypothetical protein